MATKQLNTNIQASLKRAREALRRIDKYVNNIKNAKTESATVTFNRKADGWLNNLFDEHGNLENHINSLRHEVVKELAAKLAKKAAKNPQKVFNKSADKVSKAAQKVEKATKKVAKATKKLTAAKVSHLTVVAAVEKAKPARKVRSDKGTKVSMAPLKNPAALLPAHEHNPLTRD